MVPNVVRGWGDQSRRRTWGGWSTIKIAAVLSLFLLLTGGGGCAALPLATIGTVLGAASSAASGGSEVYSLGKLDDAFSADYLSCHEAVIAAAADLNLHLSADLEKDPKKRTWFLRFTDDLKSRIDVTIDRRSQRLCLVRVDVGWFGSEPTAKLFMDRIRRHLPLGAGTAQSTRTS